MPSRTWCFAADAGRPWCSVARGFRKRAARSTRPRSGLGSRRKAFPGQNVRRGTAARRGGAGAGKQAARKSWPTNRLASIDEQKREGREAILEEAAAAAPRSSSPATSRLSRRVGCSAFPRVSCWSIEPKLARPTGVAAAGAGDGLNGHNGHTATTACCRQRDTATSTQWQRQWQRNGTRNGHGSSRATAKRKRRVRGELTLWRRSTCAACKQLPPRRPSGLAAGAGLRITAPPSVRWRCCW